MATEGWSFSPVIRMVTEHLAVAPASSCTANGLVDRITRAPLPTSGLIRRIFSVKQNIAKNHRAPCTGRSNSTVPAKHIASYRLCLTLVSSYVTRDTAFLVAFGKLRKATTSCVMSVLLSVRMEQLGSNWTDFHETCYLSSCRRSVEKIQVSLKSEKNNWYFALRCT
jgi:hypothetical protein